MKGMIDAGHYVRTKILTALEAARVAQGKSIADLGYIASRMDLMRIPMYLRGDGSPRSRTIGRIALELGFWLYANDEPLDASQVVLGGFERLCNTYGIALKLGPVDAEQAQRIMADLTSAHKYNCKWRGRDFGADVLEAQAQIEDLWRRRDTPDAEPNTMRRIRDLAHKCHLITGKSYREFMPNKRY